MGYGLLVGFGVLLNLGAKTMKPSHNSLDHECLNPARGSHSLSSALSTISGLLLSAPAG